LKTLTQSTQKTLIYFWRYKQASNQQHRTSYHKTTYPETTTTQQKIAQQGE